MLPVGSFVAEAHGRAPEIAAMPCAAELLRQMPEGLGDRGRQAYIAACAAPWLGPIHAGLVAAYAETAPQVAHACQLTAPERFPVTPRGAGARCGSAPQS
jgi:hypothetical protein